MDTLKKGIIVRNGVCVGAVGDKYFSTCPIGTVLSFAGQTIPNGYLLADGASYPTAEYPDLYAVIGNTYGGDGENFNVPDYRETVLVGVGENTTDTIASHDIYGLGEFKDDQLQGHWHNLGNSNGTVTVSLGTSIKGSETKSAASDQSITRYMVDTALDAITDGTNGEPRTGTTTRSKQKGVNYIIKAFHTNEGVDSGVSDDVIDYINNNISGAGQLNIKNFDSPNDTTKYITITAGFPGLGGIEINSPFVGKYMFSCPSSKPVYFGDQDMYEGYLLDGWAWNANGSILYLKVSGTTPFSISVLGSLESDDDPNSVVVISDMSDTAPDGITFTSTPIRYNAVIDDEGNSSTAYTWSSSKIAEYVVENMPPVYSGSVIPIPIASGAAVTTDWVISSAGDNYDSGRVLMLNSNQGTFILQIKGALGNTSTLPTPTVISSIANTQSGTWSSAFELSISSNKLRIKNKSGNLASWRFM